MPVNARIYGDTELFGIRLVFESDIQTVLELALSVFPGKTDLDHAGKSIRIVLSQYNVNPPPDRACVQGAHLSIARGGVLIEADGVRGIGHCWYPAPGAAELPEMIEALALFLAAQSGRMPLHASAIVLDGTAVVLAGRSGMGKSTLALTANRLNIPVLAEDTVYVQTGPVLRLWSRIRAIHVFEKDAPGETGGLRHRNGRLKKAVPLRAAVVSADQAILCVLARGECAALQPLLVDEAVEKLTAAPEPGYDLYGVRAADAVRALAKDGCWQLTLSQDPRAALALLMAHFANPHRAFA